MSKPVAAMEMSGEQVDEQALDTDNPRDIAAAATAAHDASHDLAEHLDG